MAPVPLRGTVNRPQNVAFVLAKIAELRNVSVEEIQNAVRENTLRFFSKITKYLQK